jgi:hypothetical protein
MTYTSEIDQVWHGMVAYWDILDYTQKKAVMLRVGETMVGVFREWGYNLDGVIDAVDLIDRIKNNTQKGGDDGEPQMV